MLARQTFHIPSSFPWHVTSCYVFILTFIHTNPSSPINIIISGAKGATSYITWIIAEQLSPVGLRVLYLVRIISQHIAWKPQETFGIVDCQPCFITWPCSGINRLERLFTTPLSNSSCFPLLNEWFDPLVALVLSAYAIVRHEMLSTFSFTELQRNTIIVW